jgi:hypothetical protein
VLDFIEPVGGFGVPEVWQDCNKNPGYDEIGVNP